MNSKKTIYVTLSQFCENDERPRRLLLEAGFNLIENKTGRRIREEEMVEALKDADGVLAAVESYSASLLTKLPKLKCISRCGAGADAIDLEAAKRQNIAVFVTRDEIVEPVAQMTVAMMLALARQFPFHILNFQKGLWKKQTGFLVSEWTIGLVGFGQIGRAVERYLRPFSPKILVTDPYIEKKDLPEGIEFCDLGVLLSRADCVSLHAARFAKEGPLLGEKEFSQMKKGSFLVNTARGYLVDEKALERALESGCLGGCALDVYSTEPYAGPLSKSLKVLCTPHVATLTNASRAAMELKCARNVVNFFEKMDRK